jgi:hypothetical protein
MGMCQPLEKVVMLVDNFWHIFNHGR